MDSDGGTRLCTEVAGFEPQFSHFISQRLVKLLNCVLCLSFLITDEDNNTASNKLLGE